MKLFFFPCGHISKPCVAEMIIKNIPRGLRAWQCLVSLLYGISFSLIQLHIAAVCSVCLLESHEQISEQLDYAAMMRWTGNFIQRLLYSALSFCCYVLQVLLLLCWIGLQSFLVLFHSTLLNDPCQRVDPCLEQSEIKLLFLVVLNFFYNTKVTNLALSWSSKGCAGTWVEMLQLRPSKVR